LSHRAVGAAIFDDAEYQVRTPAKIAMVDSTGERNIIDLVLFSEDLNGTNGATGVIPATESRAVDAVEGRPVAERDWSRPWQACCFGVWGTVFKRRNSPARQEARSSRSLSLKDREEISRGLIAGLSLRKLAEQFGRSPSTISREINRNQGRRKYRAAIADERAWREASRPKRCLLATNRPLQRVVARKLQNHWSPQQISGWLMAEYLDDETMRVSHETIYKELVYLGARCAEKSADIATSQQTDHAPREEIHHARTAARANR
jgi:DNA-binding CsgD family transcriptional regulator